jgi:hypothetical protein
MTRIRQGQGGRPGQEKGKEDDSGQKKKSGIKTQEEDQDRTRIQ